MLSERVARVPEAERMPLLLDVLRAAVLGVLGPEAKPPDPDKSLYELGIDSLMLIDMAEKLSKEWGQPIAASSFVEYPNMRAFAAHLLGTLGLPVAAPTSQDDGRTSRRAAMRAAR
jgi:acyl carrier protein